MNSIEFPLLDQKTNNSVISTTLKDLSNWSRLSSLWPLLYGTSCCFIEFASLIGSRFDFDRYGLVPRSSPRQAYLILTAGTVTMKMAPSLVRLYEQMPEPKYVIAMGACTITGGMFSTDSYSTVRGVDTLIPVDVYLPGCPPKPEAVIDAITKLLVRRRGADGRIPVRTLDRGASSSAVAAEPTGYPGGPYDTSLLVKYEHHVARHIWFGEERGPKKELKVAGHGLKLTSRVPLALPPQMESWLGGYPTLLQCWIHEYFPTVGKRGENWNPAGNCGLPRAMRWSYRQGVLKVDDLRPILDELTPTDVIWRPFEDHRARRVFDEICLYRGCLKWGETVVPYLPDRCLRQFGYRQYVPSPPLDCMMATDIDVDWISYHQSVVAVIGSSTVATTPSEVEDGYLEWYYRVSHPRLVPPHRDAPRDVPVPVYDVGPSNPDWARVSTLIRRYLRQVNAEEEDPQFSDLFEALHISRSH
ncbi:hypothetical protein KIW84_045238 [Lathyrus oleraceus]|uniref:NADH-plastoquinone oxidoreductase subunit K n=1 Tax=Pisum sativum TaxID=3888 RepID=A0A9D5ATZ1_PEA|nr:hypothetical protein KIW84_045238 [Pisum sativum]